MQVSLQFTMTALSNNRSMVSLTAITKDDHDYDFRQLRLYEDIVPQTEIRDSQPIEQYALDTLNSHYAACIKAVCTLIEQGQVTLTADLRKH